MPRKKKQYARKKKRAYKKRYKRRNYITAVPSGMPRQRRAKLRYCEQLTLSVSPILGHYIFRAGSPYDPNYSSVGHQPMGYDQWANLFNHYTVVGSKMYLRAIPQVTQGTSQVGIYLAADATLPYSDADAFIEAKKGQNKLICANQSRVATLNCYYSAKKQFNVNDMKDNYARLGAKVDTNPAEEMFYIIWHQTQNGQTFNYTYIVQIDYIVDFSEPKNLAQS